MPQDLLPTPKAVSCATHPQCLMQCSYLGLRFVRYHCSLWLVLAIVSIKLLLASEVERTHVRIRYFSTIARIDFVSVYGLLHDLLW